MCSFYVVSAAGKGGGLPFVEDGVSVWEVGRTFG